MKIFIHVGYAKCGSTSLQEALRAGTGVFFPQAGTNLPACAHISLPLFLKGMDDYTRQYISDEWVQAQHGLMMDQIRGSEQSVFLSSERLASLNSSQIEKLKGLFAGSQVEIIIIVRDREKYLNSTWRHAVFYHDYSVDYESFLKNMAGFQFGSIIPKFSTHFPVHIFNLDDESFESSIKDLTGAQFNFGKANTGVPQHLADLLQRQHVLVGSKLFKEIFPKHVKNKMLSSINSTRAEIEEFTVPLF